MRYRTAPPVSPFSQRSRRRTRDDSIHTANVPRVFARDHRRSIPRMDTRDDLERRQEAIEPSQGGPAQVGPLFCADCSRIDYLPMCPDTAPEIAPTAPQRPGPDSSRPDHSTQTPQHQPRHDQPARPVCTSQPRPARHPARARQPRPATCRPARPDQPGPRQVDALQVTPRPALFWGPFSVGEFFQRVEKSAMMRAQTTPRKFFQRLGKTVMMRTQAPRGSFFSEPENSS